MAVSLEQRIARKEAELSRLKSGRRQLENGQKIIIGSIMLEAARTNFKTRGALLKMIGERVTREVDKERLAPIIAELGALPPNQDEIQSDSSPADPEAIASNAR